MNQNTFVEPDNLNEEEQKRCEQIEENLKNLTNTTDICSCCNGPIREDEYIYKCLECSDFILCSICLEQKKFSNNHKTGHALIRISDRGEIFGEKYTSINEINFTMLTRYFQNQIHESFNCKSCLKDPLEPIKGLRFKCESCSDYNICFDCYYNKNSTDKHDIDHVIVVYGREISLEKKSDDFKEEEESPKQIYHNKQWHKGKIVNKSQNVSYKSLRYTKTESMNKDSLDKFNKLKFIFKRQFEAFNEIKGENIAKFIGFIVREKNETTREYVLISEYISDQNLTQALANKNKQISLKKRLEIALGIASGMYRIHELGFIHRGIQPDNIFITANNVAKIGDMSFAKLFDSKCTSHTTFQEPYMPPECKRGIYDKKLDVYMFGMTLIELFGGQLNESKNFYKKPPPDYFWPITEICVKPEPSLRPDSKLVKYKFILFNQFVNEYIQHLCQSRKSFVYQDLSIEDQNEIFFKKPYSYLDRNFMKKELILTISSPENRIINSRHSLHTNQSLDSSSRTSISPRLAQAFLPSSSFDTISQCIPSPKQIDCKKKSILAFEFL